MDAADDGYIMASGLAILASSDGEAAISAAAP